MTGVRPSLETSYDLIRGGQHIDHLAFAFVAPLQAENDVYFFHFRLRNIICKKHFLHPKVGIFLQKPNSAAHIFAPHARPSPQQRCKRRGGGRKNTPRGSDRARHSGAASPPPKAARTASQAPEGLFVALRPVHPAEPTHYNDYRRHAAGGPAGRELSSAKAGSAKRFCGMPIRKCGLVRRRSAALPGSHGRSAPRTPEASGANPSASDGYAERSCAGIAFLRSVELIPARRAGVPVRDGAGEGARRRGSAGGARDQTSRSSSDVSCDGWASDSSS